MKFNTALTLLPVLVSPTLANPIPSATVVARLSVNSILALISEFFPIGETLQAAGDLIADGDSLLADALGYSTSESDLTNGDCGDVVVIFARGTDEPGSVGALAGPPFFDALSTALGSKTLSVQGVLPYGASVTEFLEGGDPVGAASM